MVQAPSLVPPRKKDPGLSGTRPLTLIIKDRDQNTMCVLRLLLILALAPTRRHKRVLNAAASR